MLPCFDDFDDRNDRASSYDKDWQCKASTMKLLIPPSFWVASCNVSLPQRVKEHPIVYLFYRFRFWFLGLILFYPNIPQLCLDNIIRYNNVCRCLPLSGAGKIQSSSHLSAATRQKIPRQFFVQQILRRRRRLWMKLWLIWVRLKEIRKEPLKNGAFHGPQCVLGTGCDQDSRTIVTIVTKGVIWDEPATNAADLNLGEFESQKKLIGSGYCVEPAELSACIRLWAHEFNG